MTTVENPTGGDTATRRSTCLCGQLSLMYDGPDPERVSLCQCYNCQKRSGSVLSVQTRLPRDHVKIEGESKTFTFPQPGKPPVDYRSCDSSGGIYHFCPECGSAVYGELSIAPDFFVVEVGGFCDPTFPPPMISAFAAEGAAWVMSIKDLPMPGGRLDYDGTTHGGKRV